MTPPLTPPEPPLRFLPHLAKVCGLKEAILLQYLVQELTRPTDEVSGRPFVGYTDKQWQARFPWSSWVLKRTLERLAAQGLITILMLPRAPRRLYAVNDKKLENLCSQLGGSHVSSSD